MPAAPTPPSTPRIDVRTLSLAQLQQLADRGSRRARAELEGRMRASTPSAPVAPPVRAAVNDDFVPTARPVAAATPVRRAPTGRAPASPSANAPAGAPADLPTLTERAHPAGVAPTTAAQADRGAPRSSTQPAAGANAPVPLNEALQAQLELIAQQEDSASRASGPPRLLGMVLIAWGALLVLGGLISLAHGGGFYYLFCGLGSVGVGWLLMRCSRWAMVAHGVLLLVGLAWAWRSSGNSLGMALVQAAPIGIAALWMAVRPVREGLD